jgi:hypothetical protein
MALNTNIALGVQPIQQPNMLAQYGQMMALRAAQQETEGYEGVKGAIAGGMDATDPRMLQYGKRGIEAFKAAGEGRVKQQDALAKSFVNARESLSMVRTPEDLLAYTVSQFNDPLIGPRLKAQGLTPESAAANLQKELATSGFETVLKKSAMGLDGWFKDQTSRRNTDVSSGPGYMNAQLAREQFNLDKADSAKIASILGGGPVTAPAATTTPPIVVGGGGGGPVTSAGPAPMGVGPAPVAAITPAAGPITQPNVLATQVAPPPAPSVNALDPNAQKPNTLNQISELIRIGKPKAIQAADALIKQYNLENPEGEIKQDASGALVTVNKRTNVATPVLDKNGKPVMGDSKYESAYTGAVGKEQAERNSKVVTAAQSASANIQKIDSAIELLKTGDATTGLGAELRTNIDRARALFAGDIKAGKRVADTQILDALLGSDVFSMIQSLGIGARGLDTPAERDYLRQVMTGTIQMDNNALIRLSEIRRNIEVRAIEKYNTQLEKGELNKYFQTQGIKPEKIEVPKMAGGSAPKAPSVGAIVDGYRFKGGNPAEAKNWEKQ